MTQTNDPMVPILQLARDGRLVEARAALAQQGALLRTAAGQAFDGVLAGRLGLHNDAAIAFAAVLANSPGDRAMRVNLVRSLVAADRHDDAKAWLDSADSHQFARLGGYVFHQLGDLVAAADWYQRATEHRQDDFESWNNLGNVLSDLGDSERAIAAFERSISLRRNLPESYLNLAALLGRLERNEPRLRVATDAVAVAPDLPDAHVELAQAQAAVGQMQQSRDSLERALEIDPHCAAAMVELAVLYDNINDLDALQALARQAEVGDIDEDARLFICAWDLRRRNQFDQAFALANAISGAIHPVRRAHLMADLLDRMGRTDEAFDWFGQMNDAALAAFPPPPGPSYRATIESQVAAMHGIDPVTAPPAPMVAAPMFIVGFPRSGTTLLDTILMNADAVHVMEELPVLATVAARQEQMGPLDSLDDAAIATLRQLYWDTAHTLSPAPESARRIDKHPLHMAHVPLIARLFPGSPIILVERHPCDVVLSCFMANFKLNWAMRSFTSLEETARTYAAVFDHWHMAIQRYPMHIHIVRYEAMVDNVDAVTQRLFTFLDLPWHAGVSDHQTAARRRGHVRTASYAQVSEPIYTRAAGRWVRYQTHLSPVLDVLRPYAERMGYTVDQSDAPG